jgi:DNA-binding HxlR family transcriptional regulator
VSESEYLQKDIAAIRTDVEHLKKMLAFDISANPESAARARQRFGSRANMPEVYLAMEDGPKTQQQLAQATGISQSTVSRVATQLVKHGFIRPIPARGKDAIVQYTWTDFEHLLELSRIARQMLKETGKIYPEHTVAVPLADAQPFVDESADATPIRDPLDDEPGRNA